jgi:hypothetical protein
VLGTSVPDCTTISGFLPFYTSLAHLPLSIIVQKEHETPAATYLPR